MAMKRIIFAVITVLSILLCSCGSALINEKVSDNNDIYGTWKYELNGEHRTAITEVIVDSYVYVDYFYDFNEDGTGAAYSSMSTGKMEFTYTFFDNVISIDYGEGPFDTECELTQKSLTIVENNEKTTFYKQ